MWSRLQGTAIWDKAEAAYASPAGRHYHNIGHVLRLYEIAERSGLRYDRALDLAILAHDAVYDDEPEKERRSADWLLENADEDEDLGVLASAERLVMSTADHAPSADNRLVLLDLHDLGDPGLSLANRELVAQEFGALMGVSREQFLPGNAKFMLGMADRIEAGLSRAPVADEAAFSRIVSGIRGTFEDPGTDLSI